MADDIKIGQPLTEQQKAAVEAAKGGQPPASGEKSLTELAQEEGQARAEGLPSIMVKLNSVLRGRRMVHPNTFQAVLGDGKPHEVLDDRWTRQQIGNNSFVVVAASGE